jgi:peptidoglycan/LPS O-acetylase OafA/YrhL
VVSTLILTVFASTIYDVTMQKREHDRHPLFVSFSAYTNFQTLFSLHQNKSDMHCIHGIRGLSIIWIIIGHRYVLSLQLHGMNNLDFFTTVSLTQNSLNYLLYLFQQFTEEYFSTFIHHFNIAVDTFFLLSGFLVTNSFLRQLEKHGRVNILKIYLHRYLRITPVVAITIFLFLTLLRFVGDGPYHKFLFEQHLPQCEEYWWSALLHVQNYVNPNNIVSLAGNFVSLN